MSGAFTWAKDLAFKTYKRMAANQRLELRQGQSLVMTPQLQQAIKLLQLSNMELTAYVETELERNPLLERVEDPNGSSGDTAADDRDEMPTDEGAFEMGAVTGHELSSAEVGGAVTREVPLDTDFANVFTNDDRAGPGAPERPAADSWPARSLSMSGEGQSFEFEQRLSETLTLRQHLLDQLHMELREPVDRLIGIHLIDKLDGSGYLTGELADLRPLLGCSQQRLEATLARMQQFDPPGIFARSLRECLALQLADLNRLDPAMEALLDNLDLLAQGDLAALKRRCAVDDEDLVEMIREIKALDPKPGERFDFQAAQPIEPDLFIRPNPAGGWTVELNDDSLPRVLVNSPYYASVTGHTLSKSDRDYVNGCLQSANWLVKALHQRVNTIVKVATEIVRRQEAFFRLGVEHMKPLTLRDVAEAIEMHESTVSRATTNKYMMSPRGTYELKYFFTASIGGTEGAVHSAEAVRHRIKSLIDKEPLDGVLSDDHIVKILRGEGIDIARRTVAKYREALSIPSSVRRRREKAMKV
jgi:RNA polymerase sigma-54 factor